MVTWNATAGCLSEPVSLTTRRESPRRPRSDWGVGRSEANERQGGRLTERLQAIDWLFASDAAVEIAVAEVKATA